MLGDNLRRLRKERNMTLQQLADDLNKKYPDTVNFNKGKLSKWENNKEEPMLSSARIISDYFGVTIDEIYTESQSTKLQHIYNRLAPPRQKKVYSYAEQQLEEQNKVVQLDEYRDLKIHSTLSAGTGIVDLDPHYIEEIRYKGYIPQHDLAFRVSGNSMYPTFEDGEIIFVEKTHEIRNGQFGVVMINGEGFIKKVYKEEGRLRLVSLNKEYDDILADGKDDIVVVGKVIL